MDDPRPATDQDGGDDRRGAAAPASSPPSERRVLVTGGLVALALAIAGGSAFGLISLGDGEGEGPEVRQTERAVASLPEPDGEPEPVDAHFPEIDGLEAEAADADEVAGLEERLRPVDGDFAESRHEQLSQDGNPVAMISLLRVDDDDEAGVLRRDALDGLGDLFEQVGEGEVGEERIVRADSMAGTALLWLPDRHSVLVVSAVDDGQAELVLDEVVASVRDRPDEDVTLRS